jgi:hypothetical protein
LKDEVSTYTTLSEALTADILDVWILDSAAGSRSRQQDSPNTNAILTKHPASFNQLAGQKSQSIKGLGLSDQGSKC